MLPPTVLPAIVLRTHLDLTLDVLEQVAWGRRRLELHPALLEQVAHGRSALLQLVSSEAPVYAVSTGAGFLSATPVAPGDRSAHQRDLLVGRAAGSAPWLPPEQTRALLVTRLGNLLSGHAGVTPELCRVVVERLNLDLVPAVPRRSGGTAGEVIALAHAFQSLLGVGLVHDGGGGVEPAATAMERLGLQAWTPADKEGIALLAGSPLVTALAAARLRELHALLDVCLPAAAASTAALGARGEAYDRVHGELAGDPVLTRVLDGLQGLLEPAPVDAPVQAPISFRVVPQALAHAHRTVDRLREDTSRVLTAVTDSPVLTDGRLLTSGAFHEVGLAAGLDAAAVAVGHLAELSAQRLHRLLDPRSSGLATQLSPDPGRQSGLITLHKRAVGVLRELRRLAVPSVLALADTSLGQEDAQSFGTEAADALGRVIDLAREVLALELVGVRQAWHLGGRQPTGGLAPFGAALCALVPAVEVDRPLGPDVDRVLAWLGAGAGCPSR